MRNLKTKLTRRTNAYNAQLDQSSIPRDTYEINRIYQSAPSDQHANDDEREVLIKGLMFTAGIHGTAMPLNLQQTPTGNAPTARQKHYAIIHAVDVLSRDYFMDDRFSSKQDQYVVLQNYAGLGKEKIDGWLGYTKRELTGLTKSHGKYWWDQGKCERALASHVVDDLTEDPSHVTTQLETHTPSIQEEAVNILKNKEKIDSFFVTFYNFNEEIQNEIGLLALSLVKESGMTEPEVNSFSFRIFEDILNDRRNIKKLENIFMKEFKEQRGILTHLTIKQRRKKKKLEGIINDIKVFFDRGRDALTPSSDKLGAWLYKKEAPQRERLLLIQKIDEIYYDRVRLVE